MRTTRLLVASATVIFAFGLLAGCPKEKDKDECGNGILEGNEECDTNTFYADDTCDGEGFFGGTLTCNTDCTLNTTACHNCGDGIMDADEACDGTDFMDNTCQEEGFDDGVLACNNDCTLDTDGCFDSQCDDLTFTFVAAACTMDGTNYTYIEQVTDGVDDFLVWVELWPSYITGGGGLTLGAHPLGTGDEATYSTCAYCVSLDLCADNTCDPQEVTTSYFSTAGSLNLTTLGTTEGADFTGSLSNVTFTEWDLFGDDEPITDGDCIGVASHTLDATVMLE